MAKDKEELPPLGFGDKFEYKGKYYWYIKEIKVKVRGSEIDWVPFVLYENKLGTFAREKKEFFKRFIRCPN